MIHHERAIEKPTLAQLIERWENAARVMDAMDPHERERHFNMRDWGVRTPCGTVACLAGHCSLDPWFIEQGFAGEFSSFDGNLKPKSTPQLTHYDGEYLNFHDAVHRFFTNQEVASQKGTFIFYPDGGYHPWERVRQNVASYIHYLKNHARGIPPDELIGA